MNAAARTETQLSLFDLGPATRTAEQGERDRLAGILDKLDHDIDQGLFCGVDADE